MRKIDWSKERVYQRLSLTARSEHFERDYQLIRINHPVLKPYSSPEALIGMLQAAGHSFEEKDVALHALIFEVQNNPKARNCGLIALSVAMWPGLEHSYYKLLRLSNLIPDLVAEIHARFMAEVMRFNLRKRDKIAVNLQRNVEKRIRASLAAEDKYQHFIVAHSLLEDDNSPSTGQSGRLTQDPEALPHKELARCARIVRKSTTEVVPPESERADLARALNHLSTQAGLTPDEINLIKDHAIHGMELSEIAKRKGIRNGTARVQYFRAKAKLRPLMGVTPEPESGVY